MLNYIFNTGNYPQAINRVLRLIRISSGAFMLTHGIGKFSRLPGDEPVIFADPVGVGITASLALVGFAGVFGSLLLIFEPVSRLAVIPLLITMLVVLFIVHGDDSFTKKEMPLLCITGYLAISIAGA